MLRNACPYSTISVWAAVCLLLSFARYVLCLAKKRKGKKISVICPDASNKIQHFFPCWSQILLPASGCYFLAPAERHKVIKIRKSGFNQHVVIISNSEGFRITSLSRQKFLFRIAILLEEEFFLGGGYKRENCRSQEIVTSFQAAFTTITFFRQCVSISLRLTYIIFFEVPFMKTLFVPVEFYFGIVVSEIPLRCSGF